MAKYPASPETRAAHQEVLWHFGYEHFEYANAEPWARLIIERFPDTWAAADATIDLTALTDIEPRLRRVMGYRHLAVLREALQRELNIGGTAPARARAA